jgi:hypothetical protein
VSRPRLICALGAILCLLASTADAQWIPPVLRGEAPAPRGGIVLTPSLTVTQEYNDNIFLNNDNKESDFITEFTPGLTLSLEGGDAYRLSLGYNFTASVYADNSDLTRGFERQNFNLDGFYRVDPRLSFTLTDAFSFDTFTNRVSPEGISAGRTDDRSYSNVLLAGASYVINPRLTARAEAEYVLQRYGATDLNDSDIYRIGGGGEYLFTPRFTGIGLYEFGYYDIQREPSAISHSPRIGARYQFTERLTATLVAGPIFLDSEDNDEDRVIGGGTFTLTHRYRWGSLGLLYDRSIGTAGGLGGLALNDEVGLAILVTSLTRGLVVELRPRYTRSQSDDETTDLEAFRVALSATYQLTRWLFAVGGYEFFHQTNEGTLTTVTGRRLANDADQNRIYIGLQVAYPIRLD